MKGLKYECANIINVWETKWANLVVLIRTIFLLNRLTLIYIVILKVVYKLTMGNIIPLLLYFSAIKVVEFWDPFIKAEINWNIRWYRNMWQAMQWDLNQSLKWQIWRLTVLLSAFPSLRPICAEAMLPSYW